MSGAIAQPPLEGFGADAVCSCGIVGCRELGWPHDWSPVDAGETVAELCARLSAESGDRVAAVDLVIWRACNLGLWSP